MTLTELKETLIQELSFFPSKAHLEVKYISELPFPKIKKGGSLVPVKANRWVDDGYYYCRSRDYGFWFSLDGSEIIVLVREGCDLEAVSKSIYLASWTIISGSDLSFQNKIALHGNAVLVGGLGVGFIGGSGRGKSTLSAYCASQGAEFIGDDVLLLDTEGLIYPGSPKTRLTAGTMRKLGLGEYRERAKSSLQIIRQTKKVVRRKIVPIAKKTFHFLPISKKQELKSFLVERKIIKRKTKIYKKLCEASSLGIKVNNKPNPCGIIYVPSKSDDNSIYSEELSLGRGLFRLIDSSYHAKDLIPNRPNLFNQYLEVSQHISVRKLYYPRKFEFLPQVYDFIQQEVEQLQEEQNCSAQSLPTLIKAS